jgi:hypothetical protein
LWKLQYILLILRQFLCASYTIKCHILIKERLLCINKCRMNSWIFLFYIRWRVILLISAFRNVVCSLDQSPQTSPTPLLHVWRIIFTWQYKFWPYRILSKLFEGTVHMHLIIRCATQIEGMKYRLNSSPLKIEKCNKACIFLCRCLTKICVDSRISSMPKTYMYFPL